MTVTEMPKPVQTKAFTAKAITNEQARRKNNGPRRQAGEKPAKASSWVFGGLDNKQLANVLAGGTETAEFKHRKVVVSLAPAT